MSIVYVVFGIVCKFFVFILCPFLSTFDLMVHTFHLNMLNLAMIFTTYIHCSLCHALRIVIVVAHFYVYILYTYMYMNKHEWGVCEGEVHLIDTIAIRLVQFSLMILFSCRIGTFIIIIVHYFWRVLYSYMYVAIIYWPILNTIADYWLLIWFLLFTSLWFKIQMSRTVKNRILQINVKWKTVWPQNQNYFFELFIWKFQIFI